MYIVDNYPLAVALCLITMVCWGSWANTQKLASKEWPFQLFYWDYSLGILLTTLIVAFTLGSSGEFGRPFLEDLNQASSSNLGYAFWAGILFNFANLLLVIAIDIAGMAIAFPIGIGLALVIGVVANYLYNPQGDPLLILAGVGLVSIAIILDALAYKQILKDQKKAPLKGIIIALTAGVAMGFFYKYVAQSMTSDFRQPELGKLTPYTALVIFSIGIFVSNFLFNTLNMYRPLSGKPTRFSEYFSLGNPKLHLIGILGGAIWGIGMSLNILASEQAGPAIAYGLGQGATMVAAFWGVFIWKELDGLPSSKKWLIPALFLCFIVGLGLIVLSKIV